MDGVALIVGCGFIGVVVAHIDHAAHGGLTAGIGVCSGLFHSGGVVFYRTDVGQAAVGTRGLVGDVGVLAAPGSIAHSDEIESEIEVIGNAALGGIHHGVLVVRLEGGGATVVGLIAAHRDTDVVHTVEEAWEVESVERVAEDILIGDVNLGLEPFGDFVEEAVVGLHAVGFAACGGLTCGQSFALALAGRGGFSVERGIVAHEGAHGGSSGGLAKGFVHIIVDGVGKEDGVGVVLLGSAFEEAGIAEVVEDVAVVEGEFGIAKGVDDALVHAGGTDLLRLVVVDDAVLEGGLRAVLGKDSCAAVGGVAGNDEVAEGDVLRTVDEADGTAVGTGGVEDGAGGVGVADLETVEDHILAGIKLHEVGGVHLIVVLARNHAGDEGGGALRIALVGHAADGLRQIFTGELLGVAAEDGDVAGAHADGHFAGALVEDVGVGVVHRAFLHVDKDGLAVVFLRHAVGFGGGVDGVEHVGEELGRGIPALAVLHVVEFTGGGGVGVYEEVVLRLAVYFLHVGCHESELADVAAEGDA